MTTAQAILNTLISPNVADSNLEDANVVDVLSNLATAAHRVASAITPGGVAAGHDATGGTVGSLTEAVMGMTAALVQIAEAISSLSREEP